MQKSSLRHTLHWCGVPRDINIQVLLAAAQLRALQPTQDLLAKRITLSLWLTSCRRDNMEYWADRPEGKAAKCLGKERWQKQVICSKWDRTERLLAPLPRPNPNKASFKQDFHSPDSPELREHNNKKTPSSILKLEGHFHPHLIKKKIRNSCKIKLFLCHCKKKGGAGEALSKLSHSPSARSSTQNH